MRIFDNELKRLVAQWPRPGSNSLTRHRHAEILAPIHCPGRETKINTLSVLSTQTCVSSSALLPSFSKVDDMQLFDFGIEERGHCWRDILNLWGWHGRLYQVRLGPWRNESIKITVQKELWWSARQQNNPIKPALLQKTPPNNNFRVHFQFGKYTLRKWETKSLSKGPSPV